MKFALVDTDSVYCESAFDVAPEPEAIASLAEEIANAGNPIFPILVKEGYTKGYETFFELIPTRTNVLFWLAAQVLYKAEPREWHLTSAWVLESDDEVRAALYQAEIMSQI